MRTNANLFPSNPEEYEEYRAMSEQFADEADASIPPPEPDEPEDYADCGDCDDEPWDGFNTDAEADADVLASAGWGTDEDYGCYGCEDF
jgi:hypothetical protein